MTRFHTDEYVDFLTRVSPETVEEMSGHGTRCKSGCCSVAEGSSRGRGARGRS